MSGTRQKNKAKEHLKTMLLEGFNSGNAIKITIQDWEDISQTIQSTNSRLINQQR